MADREDDGLTIVGGGKCRTHPWKMTDQIAWRKMQDLEKRDQIRGSYRDLPTLLLMHVCLYALLRQHVFLSLYVVYLLCFSLFFVLCAASWRIKINNNVNAKYSYVTNLIVAR